MAATACKDSTICHFYGGWYTEGRFLGVPRETRVSGSTSNHGNYSIYMQDIDHSHFQDSELLIEGLLMSRAWVHQKRFLAPRTVHFTLAEMIWECGSMVICKCLYDIHFGHDTAPRYHTYSYREKKYQWFGQRGIIDEYSKLSLTKPADRLPAIAGIASHFENHKCRMENGKLKSSRYFAGLWEGSLPSGKPGQGVNIGNHYSTGDVAPNFKNLDCFTTLVDPSNVYGGVRSGKIVLQGRSVPPTKVKLLYEKF